MEKKRQNGKDIVLVDGLRTPYGKFGGVYREMESVDLAALVMREILKRNQVPGDAVDEVFYGFSVISEPYANGKGDVPDRRAVLKAGLPPKTLSMAINKACCSSLVAVQMAARAIKLCEGEVMLAVGADNMGRTPLIVSPELRWGTRIGNVVAYDTLHNLGYKDYNPVSVDAGEVALEYGVSREEQDRWALGSQVKYTEAEAAGKFKDEIISVAVPQRKGPPLILERDECPKPHSTLKAFSKLSTIYGSPTVTAGNAPGLDAGATAVLIMTRERAAQCGLKPLATILSVISTSMDPRMIAAVPAPSIENALQLADLTLDHIDLVEINEAFAAMPLVSTKILADKYYNGDPEKLKEIREKTNVNGGCIALGHPVGASGARILASLAFELRRRGGGHGVCSICGGLAQGTAAVISVD